MLNASYYARLTFILLTIVHCRSGQTLAAPLPEYNPTKFVISHADDDELLRRFKPLIRKAYAKINIRVEYVEVSVERGLKGTDQGLFDADLARLGQVTDYYNNLLKVQPSLGRVEVRLYCRKGNKCSADLLKAPSTLIGLPASSPAIRSLFPDPVFRAQNVDGLGQIEKMFAVKRFDYFVWVQLEGQTPAFLKELSSSSVLIHDEEMHHILNHKHAGIKARLSNELSKLLNENWHELD